jgi:hypothetical protein
VKPRYTGPFWGHSALLPLLVAPYIAVLAPFGVDLRPYEYH